MIYVIAGGFAAGLGSRVPAGTLSTGKMVGYSLPAFGAAMLLLSVAVYLPNYYTGELGLSAGLLSWVLLAGRLWDAVTDPIVGYASDRTRSRWGRRRPFFLLSAVPLWLTFYVTWSPAAGLSPPALFAHLLLSYLVLYTFWTIFWIPYVSLGMELTPHHHERTRLFGTRQTYG
jgi:GPH family glycoside/pentoside/hexuronide:cation symporter